MMLDGSPKRFLSDMAWTVISITKHTCQICKITLASTHLNVQTARYTILALLKELPTLLALVDMTLVLLVVFGLTRLTNITCYAHRPTATCN